MNNGEMYHPQNEPVAEEVVTETVAEVVAETVKPRSKKKILAAIISIVLAVAVLTGGAAAAYANLIGMPDPFDALSRTMEKKYEAETVFNMAKLPEEGKMVAELELAEENMLGMPEGIISMSASHKDGKSLLTSDFYDEHFEAYLTKKEFAATLPNMGDGEYYGTSFKNFRERLEQSIFGPESESEFAMDEATFEALCMYVELVTGEESKETKELKKDAETVLKLFYDAFRKSELSDTEKSLKARKILGKTRSVRTETYTFNEDTIRSFLDELVYELDNANDRTIESYKNLREKLRDMGYADAPSWREFKKSVKEFADYFEMGDVEIEIDMCYTATYVSAIVLTVVSEEADMDIFMTIDFGKNPTKSVDTVVELDIEVENEKLEATVQLTCEEDGSATIYALTGKIEMTPFANGAVADDDTVELPVAEYWGSVVLELDGKDETAKLDVKYYNGFEDVDLLNVLFDYTDEKKEWSLSFRELTLSGVTMTAEDMGMELKLSLYRKADKIKTEKYDEILEWKPRDVNDLLEDLGEYFQYIEDVYNVPLFEN